MVTCDADNGVNGGVPWRLELLGERLIPAYTPVGIGGKER